MIVTRDTLYKLLHEGKQINWKNKDFQIVVDKHEVLHIKRLYDNAMVWLSDDALNIEDDFIIVEE